MRSVIVIAALMALAGCNGISDNTPGEPGSVYADGTQLEFDVADFDRVALLGPDNVEVTIGNAFAVTAEGDQDALDDLKITVRGNTLRIERESNSFMGSEGRATIYVTLPSIEAASVAGSGDMTVASVETDNFDGSIAGSGNLSIASLRVSAAEFDIAGSGDVQAAGTAETVDISIAGSGSVDIPDLITRRLDVSIAGSGDVSAQATETADASIMGSGDVRVSGGAECNSSELGSGELTCS